MRNIKFLSILFVIVLVVLVLPAAVLALPVNPVFTNGNFETGDLSGWLTGGTQNRSVICAEVGGNHFAFLNVGDGPFGEISCDNPYYANFVYLDQLFTLAKNKRVSLDFLVPLPGNADLTEDAPCPGFDRVELDFVAVDPGTYATKLLGVITIDYFPPGNIYGYLQVNDNILGTVISTPFDPMAFTPITLGPLSLDNSLAIPGWLHASMDVNTSTFPWLPDQFTFRVTARLEDNRKTEHDFALAIDNVTIINPSLGNIIPAVDYNMFNTWHKVSVNVGATGVPIKFVVTGANPTNPSEPPTCWSNASGIAEFNYQGIYKGVDQIYAFIDYNNDGVWNETEPKTDNIATKYWVQLGPVSPAGPEFNEVGFDHTVSVNVGIKVSGIPVTFANDLPPQGPEADILLGGTVTNANGDASITYHSNVARIDAVYAFIDVDGDGKFDEGIPPAPPIPGIPPEPRSYGEPSVKFWLQNFITGGGQIKDGKKVTWTFSGNVGIAGNQIVGEFQLVDHREKKPVTYKCNDFTFLNFPPGPGGTESPTASHSIGRFTGNFTNNRNNEIIPLSIVITDFGESGVGIDAIAVSFGDDVWIGTHSSNPPYVIPEEISGGNFQIHNIPPPIPGRIILTKQTNPAGANGFPVTMSYGSQVTYPNGLQMSDDFQVDSGFILMPGISTITEAPVEGCTLTSVDIIDPSGGSYYAGNTVTINLSVGETVSVTLNNTMNP